MINYADWTPSQQNKGEDHVALSMAKDALSLIGLTNLVHAIKAGTQAYTPLTWTVHDLRVAHEGPPSEDTDAWRESLQDALKILGAGHTKDSLARGIAYTHRGGSLNRNEGEPVEVSVDHFTTLVSLAP